MKLYLFTLCLLSFISCQQDCSECEKRLAACLTLPEPLPVDLPPAENNVYENPEGQLNIQVTADDQYVFEGDSGKYDFDEAIPIIDEKFASTEPSERTMKINGDKMAHYDAIFQLITLCKQRGIAPILAFSNE